MLEKEQFQYPREDYRQDLNIQTPKSPNPFQKYVKELYADYVKKIVKESPSQNIYFNEDLFGPIE